MTKFLAYLAILVASILATLGNFWFTYGVWPRSWGSFVGFALISVCIQLAYMGVKGEDS